MGEIMKKPIKKCFIISPINIDLKELQDFFLMDYNIKSFDFRNINAFSNLIEDLKKKIDKVDFVCAILLGKKSPNVYFELGVAVTLQKPIFLIIDNILNIPFSLKNLTYVYVNSLEIDKIEYIFSIFFKKFLKKKRKIGFQKIEPEFIDRSKSAINSIKGYRFENKVKSIIELDQTITVIQEAPMGSLIDLMIWSESLINFFTNPIPIELKVNINDNKLKITRNQMKEYLLKRNLNLGVIIYGGKEFVIRENPEFPLIFVFHIIEIERGLELKIPFSKLLIERRNKIVHGGRRYG